MKTSVTVLRTIHSLFALFFIACIFYIYYCAFTKELNAYVIAAIILLMIEGFLVFVLNKGNCPLTPLQHKLGDKTPFFNLFLPLQVAKAVVPFFTIITFMGIILLFVRVYLERR